MSKTISIAGCEFILCDDTKSNIDALNAIIKSAIKLRKSFQAKEAKIAARAKAKAAKEAKRKRDVEKKAKRKEAAKARKGKAPRAKLEQLDLLSGSPA